MSIFIKNKWDVKEFVSQFVDDEGNEVSLYDFFEHHGNWIKSADGGLEVKIIESHGGEGEGETAWTVFMVGETYWECQYNYYSYSGYYFDGAEVVRVEPYEKLVTAYKPYQG